MIMRRFVLLFCAMLVLASCASNKNSVKATGRDFNPNEVFTMTEEDIARETRQINKALGGQWTYSGPSVDVSGKNVLSGLGKPIAKSKLKKKLKNAFKKIGLDKARPQFAFNEDGTCALTYDNGALTGTYQATSSMIRIVSSDIDDQERTILWRVVSLSSKQIVTEYSFDMHSQSYTVVVTLEKQN